MLNEWKEPKLWIKPGWLFCTVIPRCNNTYSHCCIYTVLYRFFFSSSVFYTGCSIKNIILYIFSLFILSNIIFFYKCISIFGGATVTWPNIPPGSIKYFWLWFSLEQEKVNNQSPKGQHCRKETFFDFMRNWNRKWTASAMEAAIRAEFCRYVDPLVFSFKALYKMLHSSRFSCTESAFPFFPFRRCQLFWNFWLTCW